MITRLSLNTPTESLTKYFCDSCQSFTKHRTQTSLTKDYYDESPDSWGNHEFVGTTIYETISCNGCDTCSFLKKSRHSEMWEGDEPTIERYPELSSKRKPFGGLNDIPPEIQDIYKETYRALINGSKILTGIGIRAIIETTCREHQVKGGDLKEKINALAEEKGAITEDGKEALHQLRFLGNNAAHENKPHTEEELNAALEIVDHILQALYVFPKSLQVLKTKIPKQ